MLKKFLIAVFFIGSPTALFGDWTHFGIRPMAMGNAFVSIADDYNALFYNPAGLATLSEWNGEFLNPRLISSAKNFSHIGEILDIEDGGFTKKEKNLKYVELFEDNLGENHYASLQMTPHFVIPNYGLAVGMNLFEVDLAVHRQLVEADIHAKSEMIIPLSYAHSFLGNQLHVGATVKGILNILSIDERLDISKLEGGRESLEDYIHSGWGVGLDVGILLRPDLPLRPSLGLSVTDIGGTGMQKLKFIDGDYDVSAPRYRETSVNAGFSISPVKLGELRLTTAVDFHRMNQIDSFSKKLHMGAELAYQSWIKVSAGLHQGYLTAGLDLDLGIFGLKFNTFQVENGKFTGSAKQSSDRRYSAEIHLFL